MTKTETALLRALLDRLRAIALDRAIKNRWASFTIVLEVSNEFGRVTAVTFVRSRHRTTIAIEGQDPILWSGGRAPMAAITYLGKKFSNMNVPTLPEVAV